MTIRDRSGAAKKGWARRRLSISLTRLKSFLGFKPDTIRIYEDDYELLNGTDPRIDLIRGPKKPACESEKTPIRH